MRLIIASLLLGGLLAGGVGCAGPSKAVQRRVAFRHAVLVEMMEHRDWTGAFTVAKEILAEDPENAEVLALRATIYREQGLWPEAEKDFKEALKIDSELAYGHAALAVMLDVLKRGEEAEVHHRRAVELAPKNQDYSNNLGFSLCVHGKTEEAIQVFLEALRLDPTQQRVRNNLGFAYAQHGDFSRAAEQFFMSGTEAEARNNLAFAYEQQGNLAQAFELYVEALRADPKTTRARQNLIHVANLLNREIPPDVLASGDGELGGNVK